MVGSFREINLSDREPLAIEGQQQTCALTCEMIMVMEVVIPERLDIFFI